MCYVLRHNPQSFGLTLDKNGYADVGELIEKFNSRGEKIDKDFNRNCFVR